MTDGASEKPADATTNGASEKPADATEQPKEPAEKLSTNGGGWEPPAQPKKPKKQVKHIDLPVESVTFSLSRADLNSVMEKEVIKCLAIYKSN